MSSGGEAGGRGSPAVAAAAEAGPARGQHHLHAGQIAAFAAPTEIATILGSCVAVCLWDEGAGVGGMNHFLLPHWVGNGLASPRFGNIAVGSLIEQLLALGGRMDRLKAKLFGGACVINAAGPGRDHLGTKNVEVALRILEREGIRVTALDTGGRRARKLLFYTDGGDAWVKRL